MLRIKKRGGWGAKLTYYIINEGGGPLGLDVGGDDEAAGVESWDGPPSVRIARKKPDELK